MSTSMILELEKAFDTLTDEQLDRIIERLGDDDDDVLEPDDVQATFEPSQQDRAWAASYFAGVRRYEDRMRAASRPASGLARMWSRNGWRR